MIISLFFFIVLLNWIGLVVYTFSLTSILFFSLTMSFIVFIGNLLIAINKLRFKVLLFFVPKNVPYWLLPLLIWIELISFFIRGFSLGLRLFANILSGHLLLLIISFFLNIMLYNISNSYAQRQHHANDRQGNTKVTNNRRQTHGTWRLRTILWMRTTWVKRSAVNLKYFRHNHAWHCHSLGREVSVLAWVILSTSTQNETFIAWSFHERRRNNDQYPDRVIVYKMQYRSQLTSQHKE